jgi:hypothetical protein
VADVVDHPLGDQEVSQLGQAPGRKRQAVLGRLGPGDLLNLALLGQGERCGPAARSPPTRCPADDPQQAPPLVVIDLADAYSFCHPDSLATPRRPDQYPNGASRHYRAKVP